MSGKQKGPGFGPPSGPQSHEKAAHFRVTMKKLIKYMRSNMIAMIIAFVLGGASVICTLQIPAVLGQATDTVLTGVLCQKAYDTAEEALNKVKQKPTRFANIGEVVRIVGTADPSLEEMANAIPAEYRQAVLETPMGVRPSIDLDAIKRILFSLVILVLISAVLSYVQGYILAKVAQKVSYRLRQDVNRKINTLPLSYFDKVSDGEVLSFITNDIDLVSTTLNQSLSQIVTAVTTVIGIFVLMFMMSVPLALTSAVIVPLSFATIVFIIKRSQKEFGRQQEALSQVNGHIEEMYTGNVIVKLFNHEEKSIEKLGTVNHKLYRAVWRSQFLSGLMMPLVNIFSNVSYVTVCVLGGYLVIQGKFSVGKIQAFIQYIRRFNQPIGIAATIANTLQSTAAAAERVFGFLEEPNEVVQSDAEFTSDKMTSSLEFKNVRFGYSPDKVVIHDFSAKVEPGQRIAIVGPTGAGKTTIVKLLMRFYDLDGGAIYIDGADMQEFSKHSIRHQFGMVLQDTWLFSGTIRDNIRYGRIDANDEEVAQAAVTAGADHFIKTLPGGYNFVLDEGANNISQGERQLLTIARAVLASPKILILDEATSSVDTRTEMQIQKAVEQLMQERTSFVIAHRLSTIRDADLILVINNGDIVESGKHEALLDKNGFYASIYNSQFSGADF